MDHEVINGDLIYRQPGLPMRNKLVTDKKATNPDPDLRLIEEVKDLLARCDAYLKELEGQEST